MAVKTRRSKKSSGNTKFSNLKTHIKNMAKKFEKGREINEDVSAINALRKLDPKNPLLDIEWSPKKTPVSWMVEENRAEKARRREVSDIIHGKKKIKFQNIMTPTK